MATVTTVAPTYDPAVPWPFPADWPKELWLLAYLGAGLLIVLLTLWTYHGVGAVGRRRKAIILALRLAALLVALAAILRPGLLFKDELKLPSVLLILFDKSRSMTIKDEFDNNSRWGEGRRTLERSEPVLVELSDHQNVTVISHAFAGDVSDLDANTQPDGARTDFGQMLVTLHQRYSSERSLRGLIILSDGADNGTRYNALTEAARWKQLGCPIFTFALGKATTSTNQRDIAVSNIVVEPTPVPVKTRFKVKVTASARGFENTTVQATVLIDGQAKLTRGVTLAKADGNEIVLELDAPPQPGEYKLTVKLEPLPGEVSTANNEITTYLTVTKDGVSVLIVDRLRLELKFMREALAADPRFRLDVAVRQTDEPAAGDADLFAFDKQPYDVVILGDVAARRLRAGHPQALEKLRDQIREHGLGLLMTGGGDSFGNSDWQDSPLADALPVRLDPAEKQTEGRLALKPTQAGLRHYLLRIGPNDAVTKELWDKLPKLDGMTRLGRPKDGAMVLAETDRGDPLLVSQDYGKGRVLAFGADTTWLWTAYGLPKSEEGLQLHARFWRQVVLWLAHQDNAAGALRVIPDQRRLPAGGKQGFRVELRGKAGTPLPNATFEARVVTPGGAEVTVPVGREHEEDRGVFWKTDEAGEYKIFVTGHGKNPDGTPVEQETTAPARFLVYQDDSELLRQAADHEFLARLAAAGGGRAYRADDLPAFLQELKSQALPQQRPKYRNWPEWKKTSLSELPPLVLALFVALLVAEWGLRRWWGLV